MFILKNRYLNGLILFFCMSSSSLATPQESNDHSLLKYTVKLGDIFSEVVLKHTEGLDAYAQVMAANPDINPDQISVNQILYFPRVVLKKIVADATVSYLNCNRVLSVNGENYPNLGLGFLLHQDDTLSIPPGCQLDVTFDDLSTIRLPSGGAFKITKLQKNILEKSPDIQIELQEGRVQAKITKRQSGNASFEITTPSSMTGVRGTEFRVGYQSSTGDSQTEVSEGVVSAMGNEDTVSAKVSTQQGIAISSIGHAGNVEDLPLPPIFLDAQNQQIDDWIFLLFQGQAGSDHYHLRQFNSINALEPVIDEELPKPSYLMTNLSQKTMFFEWTALTKSNLQGDSKIYGVCRSPESDHEKRCHVKFDLKSLKNARLKLQILNSANETKEVFNREGNSSSFMLIKGLLPGRYQWDIKYEVTQGKEAIKKGEFELIAVQKPVA